MQNARCEIPEKKKPARKGGAWFPAFTYAFCISHVAFRVLAAQPALILQAPQGEVYPHSLVRIAVAANPPVPEKAPDSCTRLRGPVSTGSTLTGHGNRVIAS